MRLAVGTAKFLLFFFNFIFFVTGIILIVVGVKVQTDLSYLKDELGHGMTSVSVFIIIVGVIVALISFFGCCGAIRNNYCMLMTFASLLALIFLFEFAAGIAAYAKKDDLTSAVHETFIEFVKNYENDSEAVDTLQERYKCCGGDNYTDYEKYTHNFTTPLPHSCCYNITAPQNCTLYNSTGPTIYKEGCYTAFTESISKNIGLIGGVGVGIAFIQILGIILACCLSSAVKNAI